MLTTDTLEIAEPAASEAPTAPVVALVATRQPAVAPDSNAPSTTTWPVFRLSLEQYHGMVAANILGEDEPCELLEGVLVKKTSKNSPHNTSCNLINRILGRLLPLGWFLARENSIELKTSISEPEPDGAVLRGDKREYSSRLPGPTDIALVVEVADSSLAIDREKGRVYARDLIPTYWIINLLERTLEVYTNPSADAADPRYRDLKTFGLDDEVPIKLDGVEIARVAVKDLLP